MKFLQFTILLLANPINTIHMRYLPIFVPNDYLYTNHKHLASSNEMVFAEAVREVMAKNSNIKLSTQSLKDKLEYLDLLYKQKAFT